MNQKTPLHPCNPLAKKFGDVRCTEDPKTFVLLDELCTAFNHVHNNGLTVDKVCLPKKDYVHLFKNTDLFTVPSPALNPMLLGAQVIFSDTLELRSDAIPLNLYPNKTLKNGYLLYSEPIHEGNGFTVRVVHPVFAHRARSGLVINVRTRSKPIAGISDDEWRAIETLREMISEQEYRRYIRDGFISVLGKSGRVYQIFRDTGHMRVWFDGKLLEEICVTLKDKKIPQTDRVISMKTIIETSEDDIKKLGNVYKMAG